MTWIDVLMFSLLYIGVPSFFYPLLEELFENPLYLGLVLIFWPLAIVLALPYLLVMLFINWIKSCIEYYREKKYGKN